MIGLRSVTKPLDPDVDLLGLLERPCIAWLTEATSLVAFGPFIRIECGAGPERYRRAIEIFDELLNGSRVDDEVDVPGTGPLLFGSWTFDPQSPGSVVVVPTTIYGKEEGTSWVTTVEPSTEKFPVPVPVPAGRDASGEEWMAAVAAARSVIKAGELQKVVLARQVTVKGAEEWMITERLRRTYPGCFVYRFENLIGASPELLVRRLGDVVDSIPLAGSARRGSTEDEDAEIGRGLQDSAKNRSEHAMTVASVMERLQPYCAELVAEEEPSLLLLENLQHLSTKVQGRLKSPASALELAGALHPTAAVCGVPAAGALEFIRKAETFDRGRYAGPIGWMDRHGDGEWALALRCALLDGSRARLYAGAGIVADSDPADEWEETNLKLSAMLRALRESQ